MSQNTNLPKSAFLTALENDKSVNDKQSLVTKGIGVIESVQGLVVPELTIFNDYVAVLRSKRKSDIVLTGSSEYSNVGIIVGFGKTCTNNFILSTPILFNGKGGAAICKIEGLPPEYVSSDGEPLEVVMVQERNIFYSSIGEEIVTVVDKGGSRYRNGVKISGAC